MTASQERMIKNDPATALLLFQKLKAENKKLKAILKEAGEYLDTNELTSIGHGSILHRKFKGL